VKDQLLDNQRALEIATGQMIFRFGRIEFLLRRYIGKLSGSEREVITVLIGFPRVGTLIEMFRKLLRLRGAEEDAYREVDSALTQLYLIGKMRDRLVHYGAHAIAGDEILVRSRPSGTTDVPPIYALIQLPILNHIQLDLQQIEWMLSDHMEPIPDEEFRRGFRENIGLPWRYKDPQQGRGAK
jgi:hypothetical protein